MSSAQRPGVGVNNGSTGGADSGCGPVVEAVVAHPTRAGRIRRTAPAPGCRPAATGHRKHQLPPQPTRPAPASSARWSGRPPRPPAVERCGRGPTSARPAVRRLVVSGRGAELRGRCPSVPAAAAERYRPPPRWRVSAGASTTSSGSRTPDGNAASQVVSHTTPSRMTRPRACPVTGRYPARLPGRRSATKDGPMPTAALPVDHSPVHRHTPGDPTLEDRSSSPPRRESLPRLPADAVLAYLEISRTRGITDP
jgi:hypothetical protein